MELRDRTAVATFFCEEPIVIGRIVGLGGTETHHARVRRIAVGDRVRVVDGAGTVASGSIVKLAKAQTTIEIDHVARVEPSAPPIHLIAPIADRDRMLLLAEKATELGVASWRPVMWRRSRSVSPRGEGVAFQAKTRSRMIGALTQSGGAWLPVLYPEATLDRAIAASPAGPRWLLDAAGDAPVISTPSAPLAIAVGPEGGIEADERAALLAAGFLPVSLGPLTLRFETAAIGALAIARAALLATPHPEALRA